MEPKTETPPPVLGDPWKCVHYRRIHQRVCQRVFADLPQNVKDELSFNVDNNSELYDWFVKKVNTDALRLFADPNYYDNALKTFRTSHENDLDTMEAFHAFKLAA